MIDKVEMRTNEQLNFNMLSTIFPGHQISRKRDSLYKTCLTVKREGKELITLKANPEWGEVYESKIIINPAKWESYDQLTSLFSKLCNINCLEVTRIDHAIDVSIPLDQLYSGIRIKHKKGQTTFKECPPPLRAIV